MITNAEKLCEFLDLETVRRRRVEKRYSHELDLLVAAASTPSPWTADAQRIFEEQQQLVAEAVAAAKPRDRDFASISFAAATRSEPASSATLTKRTETERRLRILKELETPVGAARDSRQKLDREVLFHKELRRRDIISNERSADCSSRFERVIVKLNFEATISCEAPTHEHRARLAIEADEAHRFFEMLSAHRQVKKRYDAACALAFRTQFRASQVDKKFRCSEQVLEIMTASDRFQASEQDERRFIQVNSFMDLASIAHRSDVYIEITNQLPAQLFAVTLSEAALRAQLEQERDDFVFFQIECNLKFMSDLDGLVKAEQRRRNVDIGEQEQRVRDTLMSFCTDHHRVAEQRSLDRLSWTSFWQKRRESMTPVKAMLSETRNAIALALVGEDEL